MTAKSGAFDLLDPRVQRWIWKRGWRELRDVQERSVKSILDGRDVIIASATAGGKTEAAFLPIATSLGQGKGEAGIRVLYIGPLKALINDQHRRLEELFEDLSIPVHRWHGDVAGHQKKKLIEDPRGVLLITPESLEAQFVRHGSRIPVLFGRLSFIVIDELHAYIGTERGMQLRSLLHRLELAARRRIPRIALSATLGDMDLACDYLRPGLGLEVVRVISGERGQEVRLQVRGYTVRSPLLTPNNATAATAAGREVSIEDVAAGDEIDISQDLFDRLRGGRHLIFANRRAEVERYGDLLRRNCERERVPNQFWPHHGSLDKALREDAEDALKEGTRPTTVIATTTLELGIDIGSVESVAQIGPPPSVTSMRQRLGRSGRRGDPAVLRLYIQEPEIDSKTPPQDLLRPSLVQTVAMVRLLVERWYEPPLGKAMNLSTLVQQVLSTIAQYGGVRADQAWSALCGKGPFEEVEQSIFVEFLRDLGGYGLITQTHDGMIVLDLAGERLVNHFDFYAAFSSPEEYRLVHGGKTLGSLPILFPLLPGLLIIFGGRRWKVVSVDEMRKVVDLVAAAGGKPPVFGGSGALVHDRVRQEMKHVYEDEDEPGFLDSHALELLSEGRRWYREMELESRNIVEWGRSALIFPWAGDRVMNTIVLMLRARGLEVADEGIAILVEGTSVQSLHEHLEDLHVASPVNPVDLARSVRNKQTEKNHIFLGENLLSLDYASSHLDPAGAGHVLTRIVGMVGGGVD